MKISSITSYAQTKILFPIQETISSEARSLRSRVLNVFSEIIGVEESARFFKINNNPNYNAKVPAENYTYSLKPDNSHPKLTTSERIGRLFIFGETSNSSNNTIRYYIYKPRNYRDTGFDFSN